MPGLIRSARRLAAGGAAASPCPPAPWPAPRARAAWLCPSGALRCRPAPQVDARRGWQRAYAHGLMRARERHASARPGHELERLLHRHRDASRASIESGELARVEPMRMRLRPSARLARAAQRRRPPAQRAFARSKMRELGRAGAGAKPPPSSRCPEVRAGGAPPRSGPPRAQPGDRAPRLGHAEPLGRTPRRRWRHMPRACRPLPRLLKSAPPSGPQRRSFDSGPSGGSIPSACAARGRWRGRLPLAGGAGGPCAAARQPSAAAGRPAIARRRSGEPPPPSFFLPALV